MPYINARASDTAIRIHMLRFCWWQLKGPPSKAIPQAAVTSEAYARSGATGGHAQQTHTGITPNIRRLISHWFLFPRRLSVDSIGHIARSCMLEKQTLRKILDFCDGPYDFMLIENIPVEHRPRREAST